MDSYAQTNIQLLNQLQSEGYSENDLVFVQKAYELAMHLFTGLFRPSGKTFIDHSIGTASILISLRVPLNLAVAGLLHAAYTHGDFGSISLRPISEDRRRQVRHAIGDRGEEYVTRYTSFRWNSQTIPAIRGRLDTFSPIERDVVLMRLANELEDNLNLGALYCSDADSRKRFIERCGPIMVDMADKLGFPTLASELERVFLETTSTQIAEELRSTSGQIRAYLIAPNSYRKRLSAVSSQMLSSGLGRSRKSFRKMMQMYSKFLDR
jgi:(p)ppGpp synthase/HD superfamily hydrolase